MLCSKFNELLDSYELKFNKLPLHSNEDIHLDFYEVIELPYLLGQLREMVAVQASARALAR